MNFSGLFISRPVMTTLVMLSLAFFGVLSYNAMPVSDLPDVDFPTIEVTVDYPGASPQTIANNVVVPLEQQFSTISGIMSMSSTSYTGSATIVLQFDLNKNIDLAAPDVQAAINAAEPQLPKDLPYAPTYTKANPTATPILFFSIYSETAMKSDLYDYAHSLISERLNIIEGVSQVQTFGQPYAVRVQVDPRKLAARGMGITDVGNAIQNANVYLPLGTLFGESKEYTINCDGQIYDAENYNSLIMKIDPQTGAIVRLRDIGKAFRSVQNDKIFVNFLKGEINCPSVGLAIQKQPGANTLATINRINAVLPDLEKALPPSIKLYRMYDQSDFIIDSVKEVEMTLFIALALVVIVIFFYLGKFIETFIPSMAIPMSVLVSLIVLYQCGYSIDILSLLAITLAIGFLVDDAIVVLENVVRHVEMGQAPLQAAYNGAKEIGFTILSMTLCLSVIFIPLLFMGGIVGRILHEFAMTIVIAVIASGVISLSLTPVLCSKLVKPKEEEKESFVMRMSKALNTKLLDLYRPALEWALKHRMTVLLFGVASLIASLFLAIKLPKDFLPGADIGFIQSFSLGPDGTSPFLIEKLQHQYSQLALQHPSIDSIIVIGGTPQDNEGMMYLRMKEGHKETTDQVVKSLYAEFANIPGATVFLRPLPLINLQVGTTTSKADYQFTMQSISAQDLYTHAPILMEKMQSMKGFTQVNSDLDISQPQLSIEILRDKASMLGITAQQIEYTLQLAYSDSNLSPINEPQNQYYVIMETLPEFYRNPSKLSQLWLTSNTNQLVPLTSVVSMKETLGPLTINHLDGLPSATISFNIKDVPLETAINSLQSLANEILPATVSGKIQGAASIFKSSFANIFSLLIITFFLIYVILGILYESFYPPITVMSTLPPAALGGLLSLMVFGDTLSLYAVVGIILLLGIVMKNGIIMIDFANESRTKEEMSAHEAAKHACLVRFRPILMTTFSAIMGALPIAIGVGGSVAASRKPLGIVIVGGLLFSQVLTLFFTPVTYTYVEQLKDFLHKKRAKQKKNNRL
jgi:hydrophobic/amphiphilic exporter-1 (mainly G- bacteria), HAE1 family